MEKDKKGNRVEKLKKKKSRPGSKRSQNRDVALIIDLESTCWMGPPPEGMHNEIIEFGIAGVDYTTKEIIFKESIIVKPLSSEISSFCTKLTTIDQKLIDEEGVTFEEACNILRTKFKSKDRIWLSWGEYDKTQVQKDCDLRGVENPFGRVHFNLKPLFSFAMGIHKDLSVAGALNHLNIPFEGTAHRGVDDAYNTAKILQKVFIPLLKDLNYNKEKTKKEHEILEEYLNEKYDKNLLDNNVSRVINKNTPQNPDKSMR